MRLDFTNKKVLLTGHSRGIGKAIATLLESLGAEVTGISSSELDLRDTAAIKSFLTFLCARKTFDICINNAGINKIENCLSVPLYDFEEVLCVNAYAPLLITQVVAPAMVKNGWGRIVNISSIFGELTKAKRLSYCTSKHALNGITKTFAVELARQGVLVNSVAAGFTRTELTDNILKPDEQQRLAEQIPAGRFCEPEEIARLVVFLCSDLNTYITGQNIYIDGGFTII